MSEKLPVNTSLLQDLVEIIELGKQNAVIQVNSSIVQVYWQIGRKIKTYILKDERAEYGKRIMDSLAEELVERFGNSFKLRNLRRMVQFTEVFSDFGIVSTLSTQLTWSHFILLLPLKDVETRQFYAAKIAEEQWSVRYSQNQIERKIFERSKIASSQLPEKSDDTNMLFKDPYILDFLGLKDSYLEEDLESAILKELELFILELGVGFTFVARQKRMIIDGEDFYLDLLFYHRKLKRLVAVELKIGKFKVAYKGQMELYLKWL